jgi:two-component system cell cycle sensor histidine kinase/response regulator CckA
MSDSGQGRIAEPLCLDRTMAAVGAVAARVAHDFNNVLTGIRGNAELAMLGLQPDHPARADLEELGRLVERATRMTGELMAFGRYPPLDLEVLDFNSLVEAALDRLRRAAGSAIMIRTRLTPEPVPVRADPAALQRVLMQLTDNARKAMPNGGELVIATARLSPGADAQERSRPEPGEHVSLTLSDRGVGIPG